MNPGLGILAERSWIAELSTISDRSGVLRLIAGVSSVDQGWLYQALGAWLSTNHVAHRWRMRLAVRSERGLSQTWAGSDYWVVEETLIDDMPRAEALHPLTRNQKLQVELAVKLELFSAQGTVARHWSATETFEATEGRLEVPLREEAELGGLPFVVPAPLVRSASVEDYERWSEAIGWDSGLDMPRVAPQGCVRREPGGTRVAAIEPIASEQLGAPCGLLTVFGAVPSQSLIAGAVAGAELGFVREGLVVKTSADLWLVAAGTQLGERIIRSE